MNFDINTDQKFFICNFKATEQSHCTQTSFRICIFAKSKTWKYSV